MQSSDLKKKYFGKLINLSLLRFVKGRTQEAEVPNIFVVKWKIFLKAGLFTFFLSPVEEDFVWMMGKICSVYSH